MNLRDRVPGLAALSERVAGFSARRSLPRWRRDWFRGQSEVPATQPTAAAATPREVVLLADTFNTYFEPENLRAAVRVLAAGRLSSDGRERRRARALLRPHVSRDRHGRGGARRGRAHARGARAARRARHRGRRARAVVRARPTRRVPDALAGRRQRRARRRRADVRGVRGARARGRALQAAARPVALCARSRARPLPSEGVRRDAERGRDAQARAGARSRDDRVELLRHGRRVRLPGQARRRLDARWPSSRCCPPSARPARTP